LIGIQQEMSRCQWNWRQNPN